MSSQGMILMYSTFPDKEAAEQISRTIVDLKLAACANIFPGMNSIYEWKGELHKDAEVAVLFKTTPACRDQLSKKLCELHPYDTPAIIGFDASYVEANYLSWLHTQIQTN